MTVPPLRADARRNRERILAAAAEVFAARGLEATLHDVAAHAGVGVGTVYRRFPDKHALVEALFDTVIDDLVAMAERAAAIEDPWQAFTQLLRDLTTRAAADSGLRQVVGNGAGPDRFEGARARLSAVIGRMLERAQRRGVIRADVTPVDIAIIWNALTQIAEQIEPVRAGGWQRYLDIMLEGLRGRPDQPELAVPPLSRAEAYQVRPQLRSRGRPT